MRTYSRHPYLNGLLNRLLRDSSTAASDRIKTVFVEPLINAQRRIVEAGIATGEFRPIDPDHAYFLIVGACQYLFASRVPFRNMMDGALSQDSFVRSYTTAAVDFVLRGIATQPPAAPPPQ
jgi:hypothetical protein